MEIKKDSDDKTIPKREYPWLQHPFKQKGRLIGGLIIIIQIKYIEERVKSQITVVLRIDVKVYLKEGFYLLLMLSFLD